VVACVRRAIGEKRIGHTGTLDPLATGVLALVVGRATRLARFLSSDEKEYLATVRLGMSTPTYDAEGLDATDFRLHPEVERDDVERALAPFRGTYLQTPPPFSAKKVAGVPAYAHARKDRAVELKPVEVTVSALEVVAAEHGRLELRVVASSGFYVRTLAHEVGRRLGCGAFLEGLRRTRAGDFALAQAVPLDLVQADPAIAAARLIPLGDLLPGFPRVILNAGGSRRAMHGNPVGPEHFVEPAGFDGFPAKFRLFDPAGTLLALADPSPGGLLHPTLVLV
jgi:tRNA pseudouridine55 synthase